MAISSKIDIDVDSAAFAAFQEKFDKYREALDRTPAAWRGVGAEVARTKTGFEAVAEGIGVAAGSMALISKHSTDFYHVTTATARRPDPPTHRPGAIGRRRRNREGFRFRPNLPGAGAESFKRSQGAAVSRGLWAPSRLAGLKVVDDLLLFADPIFGDQTGSP